jgi:hypothetical protein
MKIRERVIEHVHELKNKAGVLTWVHKGWWRFQKTHRDRP